jgi:hypothetical protein
MTPRCRLSPFAIAVLAAFVDVLLAPASWADVQVLQAKAELSGTVRSTALGCNPPSLTVDYQGTRRVFLTFDTSALPNNAKVTGVSLKLYSPQDPTQAPKTLLLDVFEMVYPLAGLCYPRFNDAGDGTKFNAQPFALYPTRQTRSIALNAAAVSSVHASLTGSDKWVIGIALNLSS